MKKKYDVYEILLRGRVVGRSIAVSPEKAKVNYWRL